MVVHDYMVAHEYGGSFNPQVKRTVHVYTDEEVTVMILAGNDPRGKPYTYPTVHYPVNRCKCPKIGRKYCGTCKGEGKFYYKHQM